jgi:hypothetical protein
VTLKDSTAAASMRSAADYIVARAASRKLRGSRVLSGIFRQRDRILDGVA